MKTIICVGCCICVAILLLLVRPTPRGADSVKLNGITQQQNTKIAVKKLPGKSDLSTRTLEAIHPTPSPPGTQLRVKTLTDRPNSSGWIGFVYIDTDGKQGAEKAIKILNTRNWQLLESSDRPGFYDKMLAWGLIDPDGEFRGLPHNTFDGSKKVWTAGAIKATRNGVPIPAHY